MANPYYTQTGVPVTLSQGSSASMRAEFAALAAAFDKLPTLSGNANKIVTVNGGASGLSVSPVSINAMLQMLDPTYVSDYTGIPVGAKRLNPAAGLEQWNGTTWAAVAIGYLPSGGGILTGTTTFNNNIALDWKDVGGTARRTLVVNNTNGIQLGDVDNVITSSTFAVNAKASVSMYVNAVQIGFFNSLGLTVTGTIQGTGTTLTLGTPGVAALAVNASSQTFLRGSTILFQSANGASTGMTLDPVNFALNLGSLSVTGPYRIGCAGPLVFDARAGVNGIFGSNNTTDTFTVDTDKIIPSYGLAWKSFSDTTDPCASLSGFGGLRMYTGNVERVRLLKNGNFVVGSTGDNGFRLQVAGAVSASWVFTAGQSEGLRVSNDGAYISFFDAANTTRTGYLQGLAGTNLVLRSEGGAGLVLGPTGGGITITAAGVATETNSGVELGYKGIPVAGALTNGQCFVITAGTTIPTKTAGQTYAVYNNSSSAVTLTQGAGLTLRQGGTTNTGSRTLAPFGFATIWYQTASVAVINGNIS